MLLREAGIPIAIPLPAPEVSAPGTRAAIAVISAWARIVEGAADKMRLAADEREGVSKLDEERKAVNLLVVHYAQQAMNTGPLDQ